MASQSSVIVSASGLATAITTIFNEQIFPFFHWAAMTSDVQSAWVFVLTALFGHYLSLRINNPNLSTFLKKKSETEKQFSQVFNYFEK